jgi:Lamin Tail Domain/Carboxypeptidase regulatory-like domain/Domain of unknown function (DUF4214)
MNSVCLPDTSLQYKSIPDRFDSNQPPATILESRKVRKKMLFGNRNIPGLRRITSFSLLAAVGLAASLAAPPRKAQALGGNISLGINISQVYGGAGCGTAGCSTYQNDFIELYNRSGTAISLNGLSVQYAAATGTAWQVTPLPNVMLGPGKYFLVAESFGANGVNPLPTPDATGTIAMSATAAKVALVNNTVALSGACPAASLVLDFVGYGATANCSETANAPAPSTTTADVRNAGGNSETDNNSTDFAAAAPTPRNTASAANTPTAANSSVSGRIVTNDGAPIAGTVVRLSGAQTRKTITDASGNYRFDNVETNGFYTISLSQTNFAFSPAERSFSQLGNSTQAVFTGTSTGDNVNPLDMPEYFVRQQYVDILGREPEEAGFNYWSDQILACGADAECGNARRRDVAASFFMSEEFQASGSYLYDVYAGTLGRRPGYGEYTNDRQQVVGGETLDAAKTAFAQNFVKRAEFMTKYQNAMTDAAFVDALLRTVQPTGADLSSERESLIGIYNLNTDLVSSRAAVVKALADNATFKQSQYNRSFVLTEYFAYLRRDIDQGGYTFWLNVLTSLEGSDAGNYRGMVCSFVTSTEYQNRFSSIVSHSNGECGQ